jgi:hypothetical protein
MMDENTTRLALPLLAPGQAQKEITHNEALALIDLALQASVETVGATVPPADPTEGAAWILGAAPTGDWAGRAGAIAGWTGGGWRFVAPREGMAAWSRADAATARYHEGVWEIGTVRADRVLIDGFPVLGPRRPGIADPTGGAVIDDVARATLAELLTTLRAHGLISG